MRIHRSHRKSRNGCLTCKSRKVKCDESFPICGTCYRRGTTCEYRDASTAIDSTNAGAELASEPIADVDSKVIDQSTESNVLKPIPAFIDTLFQIPPPRTSELSHGLLLDEYFQRAAIGLAARDQTDTRSRIYLDVIPRLATQYESVSQALFAVATMSVATAQYDAILKSQATSPIGGMCNTGMLGHAHEATIRQALRFYGQCLHVLRKHVSYLDQENVDAVVACSALLIVFEVCLSRFKRLRSHRFRDNNSADPGAKSSQLGATALNNTDVSQLDLNWLRYIRGIKSLVPTVEAREPSQKSELQPFFQWPDKDQQLTFEQLRQTFMREGPQCTQDSSVLQHNLLPAIILEGQMALSKLRAKIVLWGNLSNDSVSRKSAPNNDNINVYIRTMDKLLTIVQHFMSCPITTSPQQLWRVFAFWVAQLEEKFINQLCQQQPIALAIYSHFLVYMILFENFWWVRDLGAGTIQDIFAMMDTMVVDDGLIASALFQWPRSILARRKIG